MSTVVLGAGVIGTTTAWYLARDGEAVTVLERQPEAGLETSFANGGLVTPSMSDPWAAPGVPLKILKWLGDEHAPLLLRLHAVPGLAGWGLRFLRNCTGARWRRNAEVVLRIAAYSRDLLTELNDVVELTYDRKEAGTMRVFRDDAAMAGAIEIAEMLAPHGVRHRSLDANACVGLEPALAPVSDRIVGGLHFPDDHSGDAHKFTQQLAARCADAGARFRYAIRIEALETSADRVVRVHTDAGPIEADRFVLALGSFSAPIARSIGVRLPIYPVKGYSLTLPIAGWNAAPALPVADDARKLGVTPLGDRLRVAGTAEFTGFDSAPNRRRGALLLNALRDLYPDYRPAADVEVWAGLRPVTPDGPPILGRTAYSNLYLNAGQGHLGWTMACGSARVVADLVAGREPEIDLDGMTLDRF
ncbi:MAG: D-amino acid dehydrogenase [Gammaproteobacteria bacterium]